ncbi:PH domain protein (macronuclear) [Tetrahymena thermophila SB210]|uniref:PH domain protein n=1 Tax=Tetrahymena thermophila (strain SB210) TaxID=312017 RepID=Q22D82_TETTS|nr:PH domain protein [Tetrahymena thermophila SB210]EAR83243.2 PH domain protein [Tetrahymena thermophila SB210]|eukprot:XP_001030906.2 PH domain protein [Tetrahymena thermophila SB210]
MNPIPISNSNSFLGFVPSMVIQHLHEKSIKKDKINLPEKQSLKSVVMFADISGFTNLTETLSKRGPEGAEIIAFAINRYMELMVKEIGRSGGDIFKFAGDAMIVVWPPPKHENQLQNTCRQAVQAALSIQSKLDNMNITDGVKLSVKIGFGVGDFSIIYVGGIFGRAEYLPAGDPLTQAFSAEHEAESGGVINCSQQIYDLIQNHFECKVKNADHKIYQVLKVKEKVMVKADAMMIKDKMRASDIEKIKSGVLQYVPRSLQAYIQYEQEQWSSELRVVTIMFMNIGIDLSDCADEEGLNKIQKVIQIIQKCVYMYEGSLNKFLMDDKGSTLIVVFGLPPITHQDDAVRAVLCSYAIKNQLRKQSCKCSIGIGTGLVFAGVVGTSGNRREYSVIGDSVNLSARIMQKACEQQDENFKILCSEATMKQAQNKISFKFKDSYKFKGKSVYLPIYYPLDLNDKQLSELDRENRFPSLRTHLFAFPMDPEEKKLKKKFFNFMHGKSRAEQLYEAKHQVQKFLEYCELTTGNQILKGCLIIQGDMGMGKSLFLRNLIYETQAHIDKSSKKIQYEYNERPRIIVSNLDPSNKFKKMNIMRSVLKEIISIIEQRVYEQSQLQQLFGEKKYNQIFKKDKDGDSKNRQVLDDRKYFKIANFIDKGIFQSDSIRIGDNSNKDYQKRIQDFKEICGLTEYNYVENFPPPFNTLKEKEFKERHKEEKKQLSKLALEIFSIYFCQTLQKGSRKDSTTSIGSQESNNDSQRRYREKIAPLVLCLEDLQYADPYSFKLLKDILKKFDRVFIIGAMRNASIEKPSFPTPFLPPQEVQNQNFIMQVKETLYDAEHRNMDNDSFNSDIDKQTDLCKIIEINGLPMDEIKQIIKEVYNLEKLSYIQKKVQQIETQGNNNQNIQNGNGHQEQHIVNQMQNNQYNKKLEQEIKLKEKITEYEKDNFSYLFFSKIKNELAYFPDHLFHNFLYLKTSGNPLTALHLIDNLLKQKLLIIKDFNFKPNTPEIEDELNNIYNYDELEPKTGYITPHLKKAILLEDLVTIDVPLCKYNVNTPIQDKLGCLDLLILKIASVIGDIFDLQTLIKVHPFGNVLKTDKLVEALNALTDQNILEVIDQNENNVIYRFCHSFVRETLYQRLIYTQRRQIHLIVAETFQNTLSLPYNEEEDIEKLKYQWLLGENSKDISIDNLPHKAKRSIIVKKIQSQLTASASSANTMIKEDYLYKKSDFSKYSWAERFVLMSTKDIRYYYNREDSKEKPEEYLGAIPLRFIYEVNMLDPKQYGRSDYPFIIKASNWYKKTKQCSKRDFFFTCKTQEQYEEWYIYLNIAKTKALQDEFHREYGKVNILKGGLDIDVTIKNLIEQKKSQISTKIDAAKRQRRNTYLSGSSPSNKKYKDKPKDIDNTEEQNQNQQKIQESLKQMLEIFIKRGMILFFSQLFAQSYHTQDGIRTFGETTKAFRTIPFEPIQLQHSNYRSQNSISHKASVDYEDSDGLSKGNSPISSINPAFAMINKNVILDDQGNKKRVTILVNSDNNSPSHRPKNEPRKSILMKSSGVSTIFGLNESQGYQSQTPSETNIPVNGSKNYNLEQDNTPSKIVLSKVACDNEENSSATIQNANNNMPGGISSTSKNHNYDNSENRSPSKPPLQQSKQPALPPQLKQQIQAISQRPQYVENSYEEENQQKYFQNGSQNSMKRPLLQSSSPPLKYNENELTQPKLLVNDKVEEFDGVGGLQFKNRQENQSPEQSPPSSYRRSVSPNNLPNNSRFNVNAKITNNVVDMKRSSTQSTLNPMLNAQTNNTNSFYNTNNQSYLLSMNSSPSINPQSNSMINQNSFNLYNDKSQNQNINDFSRNQFDDTIQSTYKQNHFNNSQIRHPSSLNQIGNQFISSKQSEQFYEEEQSRIRVLSGNQNIQSDFQKKMNNNNSSRISKISQQNDMVPISKINNIYGDKTYLAKALKVQNPIKGDLKLEEGSMYEVKISKNLNQEYVQIVANNKSGIFKKEIFKFINNPELNTYQFSASKYTPSQSMGYDYPQQRQVDNIPLTNSLNMDSQNLSSYQQMDYSKQIPLSNVTPISMYQRSFQRNIQKNNQSQYF